MIKCFYSGIASLSENAKLDGSQNNFKMLGSFRKMLPLESWRPQNLISPLYSAYNSV